MRGWGAGLRRGRERTYLERRGRRIGGKIREESNRAKNRGGE